MRYRLILLLLLMPGLVAPTQAGIFGRKKEKIDPKARVPELLMILKSDGDADKRARAAEELRNYDASANPEIVIALIDAMLNDKKPNVRAEAASSLGKIRPVTQQAGEALEQAHSNDSSMRVRLQARSSLLSYHWAGYRSNKKGETPALPATAKEPPVINTTTPPPSNNKTFPSLLPNLRSTPSVNLPGLRPSQNTNSTTRPSKVPQALTPPTPSTKEPPLAPAATPAPAPVPVPIPVPSPVIRPLPQPPAPPISTRPITPPIESGPELP